MGPSVLNPAFSMESVGDSITPGCIVRLQGLSNEKYNGIECLLKSKLDNGRVLVVKGDACYPPYDKKIILLTQFLPIDTIILCAELIQMVRKSV